MAIKYPLVLNGTTIEELQTVDTLGGAGTGLAGSPILKGDGSGGFASAVAGTDYVIPSGTVANATTAASCSGNSATATTASSCSGNAATASNPAGGGSFITSSNIGSQSVNYANSSGSTTNATNASTSLGGPTSGQAWTNVFSSRVMGTTYTNSTGKPIMVIAVTRNIGSTWNGFVNSLNVTHVYTSSSVSSTLALVMIVPNGITYSVSNVGVLESWYELR